MKFVLGFHLVVAVILFASACSSGGELALEDAPAGDPVRTPTAEPPEPDPTVEPTEEPLPAPTVEPTSPPTATAVPPTVAPTATPTPDRGTIDEPLALVGASFTYEESGTSWVATLDGLVDTDLGPRNDEAGTCRVLIGTLTPTEIEDGLVTSKFDAPRFEMIAGGQVVDPEVNECDTDQLKGLGYQWILDAEVTEGTAYPFFSEFFLPEGAAVQAVVAGRPDRPGALFYSADSISAIPEPAAPEAGSDIATVTLAGNGFSWSDDGTNWDVILNGMIETGKARRNDEPGTCYVLLGTLTPTEIEEGLVTSKFDTPGFGSIQSGRYVTDEVNECDTDQVKGLGYQWILDAEVTVGTVFPFFTEFFVPEDRIAQAIVAGNPKSDNAAYFSVETVDTIPPPS